jgi:hypothetical protein
MFFIPKILLPKSTKLHLLMPVIACGAATRRGGKPTLYSILSMPFIVIEMAYLETPNVERKKSPTIIKFFISIFKGLINNLFFMGPFTRTHFK